MPHNQQRHSQGCTYRQHNEGPARLPDAMEKQSAKYSVVRASRATALVINVAVVSILWR